MMMITVTIITTYSRLADAAAFLFSRQRYNSQPYSTSTIKLSNSIFQNHQVHNHGSHGILLSLSSSSSSSSSSSQQAQRLSYSSLRLLSSSSTPHINSNNNCGDKEQTSTTKISSHSRSSSSSSSTYQNHLQHYQLQNDYYALRHGQSLANVASIIASNPTVACHQYGLSPLGQQQAYQAAKEILLLHLQQIYPTESDNEPCQQQQQQQQKQEQLHHRYYQGIVIITSDLLRAQETAQIVAKVILESNNNKNNNNTVIPLYTKNNTDSVVVHTDIRLRERGFGDWDGGSDIHYQDVWDDDAINPYHTHHNVESVWSVLDRVTQCLVDWDIHLTAANHHQPSHPQQQQQQHPWMVVCVAHGDVLQILQTALSTTTTIMDPSQHRSVPHLETATLRPLKIQIP
jgi:broad specificity phosphatase PhoE